MKARCKDCEEFVVRIRSDRRRQVSRFYYVDERGRLWNGRECPRCKSGKLLVKCEKKKNVEESVDDEFIYC